VGGWWGFGFGVGVGGLWLFFVWCVVGVLFVCLCWHFFFCVGELCLVFLCLWWVLFFVSLLAGTAYHHGTENTDILLGNTEKEHKMCNSKNKTLELTFHIMALRMSTTGNDLEKEGVIM